MESAITTFAGLDHEERERQLPGLLTMASAASPGWIEKLDLPNSEALLDAARVAAVSPMRDYDNYDVACWVGGFTLVELSLEGELTGACRLAAGDVYRLYSDNLYGYALQKALQALHLRLSFMDPSTSTFLSSRYLEKLLGRDQLRVGAYYDPIRVRIIGASGCEVPLRQRLAYCPGMTPASELDGVNFLAGAFDEVFARLVSNCLRESARCYEPRLLTQLRLIH